MKRIGNTAGYYRANWLGCIAAMALWASLGVFARAQTDHKWQGGGGNFDDSAKWDAAGVPLTADSNAFFTDHDGAFTISFPGGIITNRQVTVHGLDTPGGNALHMTWDLGGGEYRLMRDTVAALTVGRHTREAMSLTVTNGFLHVAQGGFSFAHQSRPATMILTGSNTTFHSAGSVDVPLGAGSSFQLNMLVVTNGAQALIRNMVAAGDTTGDYGAILVSGSQSLLTTTNREVRIARFGMGRVTVENGGHWQAAHITLSRNTSGHGTLAVDGGTISAASLSNRDFGSSTNSHLHVTLHAGGTNALIALSGNLTIRDHFSFHLALDDDFEAELGDRFTVIGVGGSSGSGLFEDPENDYALLQEGSVLTRTVEFPGFPAFDKTYQFEVSYNRGGDGDGSNDFTLTVIPEPGVLALLGVAGLGLVWMRRRWI